MWLWFDFSEEGIFTFNQLTWPVETSTMETVAPRRLNNSIADAIGK